MSLDTIIGHICGVLRTELPELVTAEMYGGRFDFEEMRRQSRRMPAAFAAWTATRDGTWTFNKFACTGFFVVVLAVESRREGQATTQRRAEAIANLVSRAQVVIAKAGDWGDPEVASNPDKVGASNPYNKPADANNIALAIITWEQDLELTSTPEPAELPPLTSIHADITMEESTHVVDAEDDIKTDGP